MNLRPGFFVLLLVLVAPACSGAAVSIPSSPDAQVPREGGLPPGLDAAALDSTTAAEDTGPHAMPPADARAPDAVADAAGPDGSVCVSGQQACAGQTPEVCVNGQWQFASAPCSGATPICVNGGCGSCSPMQMACGEDPDAGATALQTCDGTGHWHGSGSSCPYGCVANSCGPLEIVNDAGPFGQGLATDGTNVYWYSGQTAILACPVSGCNGPPTSIAANLTTSGYIGNVLALSSQYLYWPDGTTVATLSLHAAGAVAGVFAPGTAASAPFQVVVHGSNVYWSDGGTNAIYQCAVGPTCASPVTLMAEPPVPDGGTAVSPQLIAVDDKFLYWSDSNGDVSSMALSGGGAVVLSPGAWPSALVAAGGLAYYPGSNAVYSCAANAPCTNVFSPDPGGFASGLATDGASLYWTDAAGAIDKCALGATCTTPITLQTGLDAPSALAVSSTSLFWLAGSGAGGVYEYAK